MNRKKRIPPYTGMALICALALFGACRNPAGDDKPVPLTRISLPSTLPLVQGQQGSLTVTYTPANTTEKGLSWSSSNIGVATVTNGVVTAVGGGRATITAASKARSSVKASCTVTVTPSVPLTEIIMPSTLDLYRGRQQTLTVTFSPPNTTERELTWTSDTPAVATVNSATGLITAVGGGTAVITAASAARSGISATCTVTVTLVYPTAISLPAAFEIYRGRQGTIPVTYTPTDTTERDLTWTSSDPAVATVDSATGVVTGVSAGTATITAVRGGLTTSCVVTVTLVFPTAISLPDTALITKGREDTLTVTYTPDFTTETGVTWTSSNPAVAAVDPATGLITAVDVGTATITAASTASTGVTASCVVTVQPVGAGISIEFKGLEDETIILDEPVTGIGWMTLIAPAGFDRYRWYLDGSFYISTTVPGVNLRGGNFTPGNHYLTVIVNEGGYHFSKTLTFTVEGY